MASPNYFSPPQIGAHQGITGSYVLQAEHHTYYFKMDGTQWYVYVDYDPCFWRREGEGQESNMILGSGRSAEYVLEQLKSMNYDWTGAVKIDFLEAFTQNLRSYKLEQLGI